MRKSFNQNANEKEGASTSRKSVVKPEASEMKAVEPPKKVPSASPNALSLIQTHESEVSKPSPPGNGFGNVIPKN